MILLRLVPRSRFLAYDKIIEPVSFQEVGVRLLMALNLPLLQWEDLEELVA